jgi:hypothetical protein
VCNASHTSERVAAGAGGNIEQFECRRCGRLTTRQSG